MGGSNLRITPGDIYKREFKKKFHGLDPDEVEDFLEQVADDYKEVISENEKLKKRIQELESNPDVTEILKRAQEEAEQILQRAKTDAEMIERKAKERSSMMIDSKRSEAISGGKEQAQAEELLRKAQEEYNEIIQEARRKYQIIIEEAKQQAQKITSSTAESMAGEQTRATEEQPYMESARKLVDIMLREIKKKAEETRGQVISNALEAKRQVEKFKLLNERYLIGYKELLKTRSHEDGR